ncbi:MAG TPA: hypothetical protein VHB79_21990 [Polyangiaceae bacterium]|nr:hypothetical protein [Polyangiaceae bacterium]
MLRYYARLNPARLDPQFLNRQEVMRLSDVGAQLGFGLSVLHERGLVCDAGSLQPLEPVPLLTWPFLDLLDSLDVSRDSLLELGSGNSTLWFQRRFARVRSFETNPEWYQNVAGYLQANAELSLIELDALERCELAYEGESMLLIDFAGYRTRFIERFLAQNPARRPPAIVLDNSDWYRNGAALLTRAGYLELPFHGFKSAQSFVSCTSLFIDPHTFRPNLKNPFFRPSFARSCENGWDVP